MSPAAPTRCPSKQSTQAVPPDIPHSAEDIVTSDSNDDDESEYIESDKSKGRMFECTNCGKASCYLVPYRDI